MSGLTDDEKPSSSDDLGYSDFGSTLLTASLSFDPSIIFST